MRARTVEVDGISMSALCAEVDEPRAVLVAVHGGAANSRYYDLPGHPRASLLRVGAALGYTVLALDRPGYGASAPFGAEFVAPRRRVDATYRAIETLLESRSRGAGVFLVGHSAGCDLAVRMAADERGAALLGLELAGTGLLRQELAIQRIAALVRDGDRAGIRDLLWQPARVYPPDVFGGRAISAPAPPYEADVAVDWPDDFRALAPDIRVPVRFTCAEHESVWRCDPVALTEVTEIFCRVASFEINRQADGGHNLSAGYGAAAYHLGVLAFAEECVVAAEAAPEQRERGA
ncbi:alpha/beta hydrolase [Nocardia sp. NPDC057227]|uniref:alpha/beta hydrolase n=1 Tax=Nocardia sp. NPDC057227 TaxID=3346056 RepID=UPI00362EE8BC